MDTGENKDKKYIFLKGIIYSNIFAVVSFTLAHLISKLNSEVGYVLSWSEFVLVPISMGIISIKYWIKESKKLSSFVTISILNTLIAILLSAIFMGEGVICLIIVSPLILGFMWWGILIGKHLFEKQNTTLQVSTIILFISLFLYDTFSEHNYTNMVSDEIIINAPKKDVWKYVAAYPLNTSEPEYWLFKIGLPNPVQSTVSGHFVGASRKCIFSNSATFDEKITEYKTNESLTFNIKKQPDDPEIIGHIEILQGQFILRENANGTTTLIGNSWYKLNVYPVWYYDWWAEDITRNVHIRVMKHIKQLAEKNI